MSPTRIINAGRVGHEELWSIGLADGQIASLTPQTAAPPATGAGGEVIDAGSKLITAALVDPHLHLDLAYSLNLVPENKSGTLLEAIGLWSEAKKTLTVENVFERALRAIQVEVSFGTGLIRSHVDVAGTAGLRLAQGVLAAREATRSLCEIQFVAFPQDGLLRDRAAIDNVREALRLGVDLVGGIPHVERTREDGVKHLKLVFALAREFDADIDVHIDETDDPHSQFTEVLAALTIQHGWQGRVTASHVCALSSYPDVHASRVIDLLAEARVSVITNPGVNLHLQGRFDRYPKRRGLTRISELLKRGVRCGAGQDCIRDPFYPLGNGCMLDQAFLLVHADHLSSPSGMRQAFEMVCDAAGQIVAPRRHGLRPGAAADLVLFPVEDERELVRLRPRPTHVLHDGVVVVGIAR